MPYDVPSAVISSRSSSPGGSGSLQQIAPWAAQAGVTYCLEPLSRQETSVVNTVQEAAQLVRRIGSPAVRTMLDASAAG